jgi:hypothetical protein
MDFSCWMNRCYDGESPFHLRAEFTEYKLYAVSAGRSCSGPLLSEPQRNASLNFGHMSRKMVKKMAFGETQSKFYLKNRSVFWCTQHSTFCRTIKNAGLQYNLLEINPNL